MVKASNVVEIEIDGPHNQALYFRPLQRRIRGRFDLHRVKEPNAGKLLQAWPEPIPGQHLALNVDTGEGAIIEPLHSPEFAAIREKIERRGQKLGPERETLSGVHVPTWLFYLKGLVETGVAKLVSGKLPEKIDGTPQTRFHSSEQPDPIDKLTAAIERQCELTAKLLATLAAERGN